MNDPGLYMIMTRPALGYRAFMELCVREEMPVVQLRDKELSDRELLTLARELAAIRKGSQTRLIINDRPDIAFLSGACGLHLGQDDCPIDEVRQWGNSQKKMLYGLSSHSLTQAEEAWSRSPDYIGFGPVYPTPAKAKPDPAVGLKDITQIVNRSPCPVILIGGLFPENIEGVLEQGARNICLVRYFNDTKDPLPRIRDIRATIASYQAVKGGIQ